VQASPCSGQGDIPALACLPRGETLPGRAPKVQLLQRFLISTSQKQMEMVRAAASQQEAKYGVAGAERLGKLKWECGSADSPLYFSPPSLFFFSNKTTAQK